MHQPLDKAHGGNCFLKTARSHNGWQNLPVAGSLAGTAVRSHKDGSTLAELQSCSFVFVRNAARARNC